MSFVRYFLRDRRRVAFAHQGLGSLQIESEKVFFRLNAPFLGDVSNAID
jgi:hypothetical protein